MLSARCVECEADLPVGTGRGRPRRYCSRRCQARAYRRRREHGPTSSPRRIRDLPAPTGGDPRHRLVALAVELADAGGLDAVSLRVLAQRAGLPAHAVYRHVRNRVDLLAAMAEQITATRPPGTAPLPRDPRQRLERLAGDEWAMYRGHPWLLAILATDRPPTGPAVLAMVDRVVTAFTSAGYEPAEAFRAYLALSGYIQGMALLIRRDPEDDTTYHAWWSATLTRLERTGRTRDRQWLAAAGQTTPDADLDTWFQFGLRGLLDGLLHSPTR
ncbi:MULTISPECIES: TetR/AcrR family transcriptional regulator [Micromonospora]|uniref:TetR/AcrR family transcriptional regulator n=1 Tax=Micromonospora TaxID=1873 RepID=UPI001EE79687|nr:MULTISPECIES: TetR/AcrR family transcriptional regulator [Micromonospora]MCG5447592.1 TetR/AcrR family transcriptional regulator [Micromonospora hortensis]MCX5116207.1 TetR/AcrR family transcriptional regulator [Micromonospora sp. NBC_00362]WTI05516.1 TetR/AcrR family transcriptional regulator [Micromonospora sp. NBC_00821]